MTRVTGPAIALLSQFAPLEALQRARALALQIERDEYLRAYLAQRGAAILAVAVGSMLAGFALVAGVALAVLPWAAQQAFWLRLALTLLAGTVWCAGVVVPTSLFVSRLERAALREREDEG